MKIQRLYDSVLWRKFRLAALDRDGYVCQLCGRPTIDYDPDRHAVVDHVIPHRGDESLFWDIDNLQTLHKNCHDEKTAEENQRRNVIPTKLNGWPAYE